MYILAHCNIHMILGPKLGCMTIAFPAQYTCILGATQTLALPPHPAPNSQPPTMAVRTPCLALFLVVTRFCLYLDCFRGWQYFNCVRFALFWWTLGVRSPQSGPNNRSSGKERMFPGLRWFRYSNINIILNIQVDENQKELCNNVIEADQTVFNVPPADQCKVISSTA